MIDRDRFLRWQAIYPHFRIEGHSSSPGNYYYSRAFLEGRLSAKQLDGFRQELTRDGLSSYPHPWLMLDFWQFPTVSLGIGPITSIY